MLIRLEMCLAVPVDYRVCPGNEASTRENVKVKQVRARALYAAIYKEIDWETVRPACDPVGDAAADKPRTANNESQPQRAVDTHRIRLLFVSHFVAQTLQNVDGYVSDPLFHAAFDGAILRAGRVKIRCISKLELSM